MRTAQCKDFQDFQGERYYLHKGERYYKKGDRFLHHDVWKHYHGEIPKGMEIHHVDGDVKNNSIENLVCLTREEHNAIHHDEVVARMSSEKQIKHLAAIREDAKAWHASEEGRRWHSEHGKKISGLRVERRFVCEQCGKEFASKQARARFCSNTCKSKWRRDSGLDNEVRVCAECGAEFTVNKYSRARFCGYSCSTRCARREKHWSSR